MSLRKSLLPKQGGNKFQIIKAQQIEAQRKNPGLKIIKLSIGQPEGPAILEARQAAAEAIMSDKEYMHEYQDNHMPGCPDFAPRFVQCHVKTKLSELPNGSVDFLAIPGIKPTLDVVIKALGSWTGERENMKSSAMVGTMTDPGYPTPADMCQMIRGIDHFHLPMLPEKGFLFDISDLEKRTEKEYDKIMGEGDLIMLNLPLNPAGVIATKELLSTLCSYCQSWGIRLVNDSAYSQLVYSDEATTLTDVAVDFPDLNWAEMFSASKAGNNTGWRIGAVVGSPEFMADIKRVNGNMNSGPVAAMAIGALTLFEKYPEKIAEYRMLYQKRLDVLKTVLREAGMRLAVNPQAGFFLLYDCPAKAFSQDISDAEQFNALMIERTGIIGIPFGKYIRYAICAADVIALKEDIRGGFGDAKVSY